MIIEQLESLCKRDGKKISNVLREVGASPSNTDTWKKGYGIKSDLLIKLADYFNVSTDYILGREEKKNLPNNIDQSVHSSMIEYNAPVANSNINSIEKEKKLPVIQAIVDGVESLEETDQAEVLLYIYKLKNKPSKN